MSARWDPAAVKAQLRLTSQRIGQLLERQDSKSQIVRRDIATLLSQGNVMIARAKAQKLIHEDVSGDILEMLEMCIGVLVEHFNELRCVPMFRFIGRLSCMQQRPGRPDAHCYRGGVEHHLRSTVNRVKRSLGPLQRPFDAL